MCRRGSRIRSQYRQTSAGTTSFVIALLLLVVASASAEHHVFVRSSSHERLQIAPDLVVWSDLRRLYLRSGKITATWPLPYRVINQLERIVVDDGRVTISYVNWCGKNADSDVSDATTLDALRARVRFESAHQTHGFDEKLVDAANALDPTFAAAAVAKAARAPASATATLAPAIAASTFATYLEILRQPNATALRGLPEVVALRASSPGDAHALKRGFAIAKPYVAILSTEATEADCSNEQELLIFDTRNSTPVFRYPYIRYRQRDCKPFEQNQAVVDALLADMGFVGGDAVGFEQEQRGDTKVWKAQFAAARLGLVLSEKDRRLRLLRGNEIIADAPWRTRERPERAFLLNQAVLLEHNRDSDVCEGMPTYELVRRPNLP